MILLSACFLKLSFDTSLLQVCTVRLTVELRDQLSSSWPQCEDVSPRLHAGKSTTDWRPLQMTIFPLLFVELELHFWAIFPFCRAIQPVGISEPLADVLEALVLRKLVFAVSGASRLRSWAGYEGCKVVMTYGWRLEIMSSATRTCPRHEVLCLVCLSKLMIRQFLTAHRFFAWTLLDMFMF